MFITKLIDELANSFLQQNEFTKTRTVTYAFVLSLIFCFYLRVLVLIITMYLNILRDVCVPQFQIGCW